MELLRSARAAIDAKQWANAKELAKKVLEADEKNYNALLFAGLASFSLKDFPAARELYGRATRLQPRVPAAWRGWRDLALAAENWVDAAAVQLSLAELSGVDTPKGRDYTVAAAVALTKAGEERKVRRSPFN